MIFNRRLLISFDWLWFFAVLLLAGAGLVAIWSTTEVARVSAPAKRRSVSRMTLSAPRQRASRRTLAALGGPIVITVTVPPWRSLIWSAISRALRSLTGT